MTALVHYISVDLKNSTHNIIWVRRFLFSFLLIAFLTQIVLAEHIIDIVLAALSCLVTAVITRYVFNKNMIGSFLVSRLALMSGAYSLLGAAVIFKSLNMSVFTTALKHPVETITFANIAVLVFLLAHIAYEALSKYMFKERGVVKSLYLKSGLFRELSRVDILLLSLVGLASIIITWVFFLKDFESNSLGRAISIFSILYFAPVVYIFYASKYKKMMNLSIILMIPICLAISSMTGRRGFFADYTWAVFGAFFLMFLVGAYRLNKIFIRRFIIVSVLILPIFSVFKTISDAMLSVRNDFHESLNYSDNIVAVKEALFSDKPDTPDVPKNDVDINEFSEVYTGNFIFDRFVLIKYMDNLVDFDKKAPDLEERLWIASVGMFNNLLPNFITNAVSLSDTEPSELTVMDEARCAALNECGDAYIFGSWVYMSKIFFGYIGGLATIFLVSIIIFTVADFLFITYDAAHGVSFSVPFMLFSANIFWFSLYSSSLMELVIAYLRFLPRKIIIIFLALIFIRMARKILFK